jgi:hypothetical protein
MFKSIQFTTIMVVLVRMMTKHSVTKSTECESGPESLPKFEKIYTGGWEGVNGAHYYLPSREEKESQQLHHARV